MDWKLKFSLVLVAFLCRPIYSTQPGHLFPALLSKFKVYHRYFSFKSNLHVLIVNLFWWRGWQVVQSQLYGCTYELVKHFLEERHNIEVTFVDSANVEEFKKAIRPNTKVRLWLHKRYKIVHLRSFACKNSSEKTYPYWMFGDRWVE